MRYDDPRDAQDAMDRMNGKEFEGRQIRISIAEERPPKWDKGELYGLEKTHVFTIARQSTVGCDMFCSGALSSPPRISGGSQPASEPPEHAQHE